MEKVKKYEMIKDGDMYRVKALIKFSDVNIGDIGGFIEKENNLSHNGNAWVYGNAKVSGNAEVFGKAKVSDNAWVYGNAWVYNKAKVYGNTKVYDDMNLATGEFPTNVIYIRGTMFPVYWDGRRGYIRSGCICKPIEWWDENLVRCAVFHCYTPQQIEEYKIYFEAVKKWMVLRGVDKIINETE